MGDIFADGGVSAYPTSLDTRTTQVDANPSLTFSTSSSHASKLNELADATIAIETELGTLPKGSYADVKTALADAVIKTAAASQTITHDLRVRRLRAQGTALVASDFTIGSGWGSTATLTVDGTDQRGEFIITCQGAGIAANPTVVITFKDGAWPTGEPFGIVQFTGGTGAGTDQQINVTRSTTAPTWQMFFTPTSTLTYVYQYIFVG